MNQINDIGWQELMVSLLMLFIPISFLAYYKVGIIKPLLISVFRMMAQLGLVAVYLEWVFERNNPWINLLWVLIMIFVGVMTAIRRVDLQWKTFIIPMLVAGITSVMIVDAFFLGWVIKLEFIFDARYFIPITGMILGNSLNNNVIGLNEYLTNLRDKSDLYYFILGNTNTQKLALRPFISNAFIKALNPTIATMSVMGLIALPGMMTGQILGGSPPAEAIKYQIMIMLAIFIGSSLNLILSVVLVRWFVFDGLGNLKTNKVFLKIKK
ncbi:ABC transporter permease [Aureibacter tunicatorum]|uniref:ABC transport system permease protein n=1 Tax=Aureibacter tunicatorum TaxID=866807 RepID=A0AAE4BUD9_9BACT|nr:ABC transporter permease [Aureibacter tunicatorum]MDR6241691.1 putative ABC transport system permease protein [Aureibacter tunicatorum]BDD07323.1 ABC transporter permease [Aureibacter tunicatorum]